MANNNLNLNNLLSGLGGSNGTGSGGGKSGGIIGIIILVIIVIVYISNFGGGQVSNYSYSGEKLGLEDLFNVVGSNSDNTSSYGGSTTSWFSLLTGNTDTGTHSINTDYSTFEDTSIKNKSNEKYTLLIYLCGSNLESDGGYASADLEEMLKATIADEVNVLVYTGGARRWFDYGISSRTNQIYEIKNHKLHLVKNNLGLQNMADPNTLASFLKFAKENYPSDKYSLIMWDHGGGAVSGFAQDQNTGRKDTLTIDEIKNALDSFENKFEFVGFDACLMANFETAYALKDNANYLIASEETEPGTGWDYISILNTLSKNTSQTGDEIGKTIVDSFIASNSSYRNPDATLSCIDLNKMDNVYSKLVLFMKDIKSNSFDKKNYNMFAKYLVTTKAFGEGKIDTIDLVDFATKMNSKSSNELISAVLDAVTYNKTNKYVQNANGMSIFIPNKNISQYQKMLSIYNNIGITSDYYNVLTQYVNLVANGRQPTYSVNNHTYQNQTPNYSSYDWFDILFSRDMKDYYEENKLDTNKLNIKDKGDYFALSLSDKEWKKIAKVESSVWYDDGNGYIDMGIDSGFDLDESKELKIESDGTWLAINGDNIHYEVIERTDNYELGIVPARINNTERVNLLLYFDKENPDGEVLGYEPDYEKEENALYEKGIRPLVKGDKIDFIAPRYGYEEGHDDEYLINDTLTIGDNPLVVSYESLGDNEILLYYRLTDIFGNVYYTEPVILE